MNCIKIIIAFLLVIMSGCISVGRENYPCLTGQIEISGKAGGYGHADPELSFIFYNESINTVEQFSVIFSLYRDDAEDTGQNTGYINFIYTEFIGSYSSEEVRIKLTDYISDDSPGVWQIEDFCITEIKYTDGSVWHNTRGSRMLYR